MRIVIPGAPVPQGRMRYASRGKFGHLYDPMSKKKKEIREYLATIPWIDQCKMSRVSFIFHMPIPRGLSKHNYAWFSTGYLLHEKKPDVDNLVKLYLDCLDGFAYNGDSGVSLGPCIKLYHPVPKTIIRLEPRGTLLHVGDLDQQFWLFLNAS